MNYLGDFSEDSTVTFEFTTNDAAGGAIAPSSAFEVADLKTYKNGVTFNPSGITITSPFDGTTGLHQVKLDTSNDGGDDWLKGADYSVVLSPDETVDGQTVVAVLGEFSIENRNMRGTDNAALDSTVAKEATVNALNNFDPANDTIANVTTVANIASDVGVTQASADKVWSTSARSLTDKADFLLAATGLDAIPQTAIGIIEIAKATWDRVLTNTTHNITKSAGKRVRGIEEYQGYIGGFIYIDTIGGTAGSESYINGTLDKPVNNLADANTISAALGISSFKMVAGSTVTFTVPQENQEFFGEGWNLALGNQSISGTFIHGADVSGTCTGTIAPKFSHCAINGVILPPCNMDWCAFTNTITIGSAGDFFFYGCHSAVAGINTPAIDFGTTIADTNLNIRLYSGGIELKNIGQTGTDNVSIEGNGQIILNANCVAGTLAWRGHFVLDDNSSTTAITGDNIASDLAAVQAIAQKSADAAFGTYELDVANSQLVLKNESLVEVARWDLTPDYVNPSGKTRV